MLRNLDRRVEVVVPVTDPEIRAYLINTVLESYLKDNVNAKVLRADGSYRAVPNGSEPFDAQIFFAGRDVPD